MILIEISESSSQVLYKTDCSMGKIGHETRLEWGRNIYLILCSPSISAIII